MNNVDTSECINVKGSVNINDYIYNTIVGRKEIPDFTQLQLPHFGIDQLRTSSCLGKNGIYNPLIDPLPCHESKTSYARFHLSEFCSCDWPGRK